MREYRDFTKDYLTKRLKPWRNAADASQEDVAEMLRMSSRSYASLERGKNGFSSTTLLLFLAFQTDEEILRIVRGFLEEITQMEQKSTCSPAPQTAAWLGRPGGPVLPTPARRREAVPSAEGSGF